MGSDYISSLSLLIFLLRKYVVPRFCRILLPRNENLKIPEVTSRTL